MITNKKRMFKKRMKFLVILCLLSFPKIFAQPDETEGPQEPPQTLINELVLPFILVGILVGGYFFYKKNQLSK